MRLPCRHVGILTERGTIIHSDTVLAGPTRVREVSAESFRKGRTMRIDHCPRDPARVLRRARMWIGLPFDMGQRNCEHLAMWALTGTKKSPQLRRVMTRALVTGMYALALGAAR